MSENRDMNLRNFTIVAVLLLVIGVAIPASAHPNTDSPASSVVTTPASASVVEPVTTTVPETTTTTAAPVPAPVVEAPANTTTTIAAKRTNTVKRATVADGPQPAPIEPPDPNPTRDGKDCVVTGECTTPEMAKWYRTLEGFCIQLSLSSVTPLTPEAPECETDKTQKPIPYKVILDENGSYIEYPNGNPWGPPPAGTVILL